MNSRTRAHRVVEVREHFGERVVETMIARSTKLAEAPSFGVAYGRWDVSLTQSGGLNPPGLDQALASQKKLIQDNLNNWPVWPIAKLQLSFTF